MVMHKNSFSLKDLQFGSESNRKPLFMKYWICLVLLLLTQAATRASVTNVAWYRLGENDLGAASGQVVNSTTTDLMGANDLKRFGSPLYTNAVSSAAASRLESSLAVEFDGSNQFYSNAVVTTARNNFGLEAWVQLGASVSNKYLIAHNGNTAANGWGL